MKQPTYLELLRRGRGLTLDVLAEKIAIHPTMIGQVEGLHRRCYPKLRKALANALGVEEEKLFDKEGFAKVLKRR